MSLSEAIFTVLILVASALFSLAVCRFVEFLFS